jgi:hypothetical protein
MASMYWGFAYDPEEDTITLGPYVVQVDTAVRATTALADDIYQAARAVDQQNAAELRARTVEAIAATGLSCSSAGDAVKVWSRSGNGGERWSL